MTTNLPSSAPDDDGESYFPSSTPTPPPFANLHRTISRSSTWSTDTPPHHYQGTSYFPQPSSPGITQHPSPILIRSSSHPRSNRAGRSTSVSSSQATNRGYRDDDILSEEAEDEDDDEEQGDDEERPHAPRRGKAAAVQDDDSGEGDDNDEEDKNVTTLKDRQSLINVQHPFGLPIWKPALYKKTRSVTRHADEALHSIPSAQAERHFLPGNIFWALCFGWWLGLICLLVSTVLWFLPQGGEHYSTLVYGLGWYLFWPFGKYVEGDTYNIEPKDDDESPNPRRWSDSNDTVRGIPPPSAEPPTQQPSMSTATPTSAAVHGQNISWSSEPRESSPLLGRRAPHVPPPSKSYGTAVVSSTSEDILDAYADEPAKGSCIGKACYWLALISIIAPLMLFVCLICWALVITIPMAKLNWELIKWLFTQPTHIRFCAAPPVVVVAEQPQGEATTSEGHTEGLREGRTSSSATHFSIKHPRLSAGQAAPSGSPTSTVLLCTYRAVGWKYYKYTIGGVNILFVNLLPIVFFVIFDGFVLMPLVEKMDHSDQHVPAFLRFIASQGLIFFLCLLSVIPLSYFIGMAVASISAQSSIGMGAVINATFGSIIEIILYSIALTQGKGRLVEGSIVGSLLAGVLLMPGMSMCSMALRRKEQKFNAKSASVTSMMLIMAIVGTLTPTLFYQTYGNFQLVCSGCPSPGRPGDAPWTCDHCYYEHPNPVDDPFYQLTVKKLMYFCAFVLVLSYLIGLWFSLRTHATQIWQNPQQVLHPLELPTHNRISLYNKLVPSHLHGTTTAIQRPNALHRKPSQANTVLSNNDPSRPECSVPREISGSTATTNNADIRAHATTSPIFPRKVSYAVSQHPNIVPIAESVDHAVKNTDLGPIHLPEPMTTDDFTRAVAVATVNALRHQQQTQANSAAARMRASAAEHESQGGHDAPSWSRTVSASVLLGCTALYALIAELLVDVVDVVMKDSGIDEKFLGITLFALVPNTTEFMNAISFALNGNIALSMEIGSAYALQVCLLQIPAMVGFSAWYAPDKVGEVASTFTLIFPRWDVIVLILSMFLMTYTYIEAKSNYHRGSILILSYLVLIAGFYFAPPVSDQVDQGHLNTSALRDFPVMGFSQTVQWWFRSLWR